MGEWRSDGDVWRWREETERCFCERKSGIICVAFCAVGGGFYGGFVCFGVEKIRGISGVGGRFDLLGVALGAVVVGNWGNPYTFVFE